ncbi:hypothetical protein TPR58_22130 [Sphingomonas sp. HF-S3]|uniref:Uncharacterized protein n=1 Tax=Sphingomonas rustica TaxID=3103142 RepID=A0ABV0BF61_9SPHN
MHIEQQQDIRDKTSAVVLAWAADRQPPFTGETAEGFTEAITVAHLVADEAKLSLHRWIDAARRTGISWTEIGNALGISKQAAQQRFSVGGTDAPLLQTGGELIFRRVRYSAVGEMNILREEGLRGSELVATENNALVFRATNEIWEYRRRIGFGSMRKAMASEGWTLVSTWPPLSYFKRRVVAA